VLRSDADLTALASASPEGVELVLPMSVMQLDGRGMADPLLAEIPDTLSQTSWSHPLEIPAELASSQGIAEGDGVSVTARRVDGEKATSFTLAAVLADDLEPNTVALAGLAAVRAGVTPDFDPVSGELARAGLIATVDGPAPAQHGLVSVMGSADSEGRHLVLAAGLEDARAGRYEKLTRHGLEPHDGPHPAAPLPHQEKGGTRPPGNISRLQLHPEHRWGMTVDLDRCTGCGACVAACYVENNVPVVGRDEVARGRELSWIRIEKHRLACTELERRVRLLPVLCQHCDNAPCETVCPVFASYHTPDGLNAQVYNRCIGTRYCANNCPYKVRRFNYFDYDWPGHEPQRLNPDVTVRSRGVMEKCTFCVQRIREVTNRARAEGRAVEDGEIVPACVQTCPTGALSFGDFEDQSGRMATKARDPRGYRLLDWITNTRPSVVYLRKIDTDSEGAV
jgi:molybdopterin-containing oxidoreductase family iron-sulfur binding subunit